MRNRPLDAVAPSCAARRTVAILENVAIAPDTFRLRLDDPAMARAIRPGQFVMIRPATGTDPLLGRPFALYDVAREAAARRSAIDVVYLVIGRGTAALARRRPGDLRVRLGAARATASARPRRAGRVRGGGIGQTPFLALGRWWLGRADYGEGPLPSATRCRLGHAALRRPIAATSPPASRTSRRPASPSSWPPTTARPGIAGSSPTCWPRRLERGERPAKVVGCGPPADARGPLAAGRAVRHPVRPLAREPHGLRLRRLLQLRRPDPPGRRLESTSAASASRGRSSRAVAWSGE